MNAYRTSAKPEADAVLQPEAKERQLWVRLTQEDVLAGAYILLILALILPNIFTILGLIGDFMASLTR